MSDPSSIKWSALSDAYGDAVGIPALLERLVAEPDRDDVISELWSRICHQETVYSASAVAVPFLVEAARNAALTPMERFLVLGLVVYIGRGDDTCWRGYTSWSDVEACQVAVAAHVPELVRWAVDQDPPTQATALELGVYHPREFAASGVDPATLLRDADSAPVRAGAALACTIIAGEPVDAAAVRAAAELDEEAIDYLNESLDGLPVARQARQIAVELLNRVAVPG